MRVIHIWVTDELLKRLEDARLSMPIAYSRSRFMRELLEEVLGLKKPFITEWLKNRLGNVVQTT